MRSIEEFVGLLQQAEVSVAIDVRAIPRSRTNPQYNIEDVPKALSQFGIGYEHLAALGGRRRRECDVSAEVNGFWEIQSFHNYADYALTEGFRSGFARLRELGKDRPCAIFCSEAVWWRCHRRIITDYLLAAGETVFHILAANNAVPAQMTEAAVVEGPARVTYPSKAG